MIEWKDFREELLQDPEVREAYNAHAVERELARAVMQQRLAQQVTQKEMAEKMRVPQGKRLEIHYTPKHGSWLNIAEIELNVMTKQCLGRRIPDLVSLQSQLFPWEQHRNASSKSVDWQFDTAVARDKLKWLYSKL